MSYHHLITHALLAKEDRIEWFRVPSEYSYVREAVLMLRPELNPYCTFGGCEILGVGVLKPRVWSPFVRCWYLAHSAADYLDGITLPAFTDAECGGYGGIIVRADKIGAGLYSVPGPSDREITATDLGEAIGAREYARHFWKQHEMQARRKRARA